MEKWRTLVDDVTTAHYEVRLFANLKALQDDLRRQRYYLLSAVQIDGADTLAGAIAAFVRLLTTHGVSTLHEAVEAYELLDPWAGVLQAHTNPPSTIAPALEQA